MATLSQRQRTLAVGYLSSVLNQLMVADNLGNTTTVQLVFVVQKVSQGTPKLYKVEYRLAVEDKPKYVPIKKAKEQLIRVIRAYALGGKVTFPRGTTV